VASLADGRGHQGITIAREEYATSHADARLFGVLDLIILGTAEPDYGMSLGLRGSNDKSLANSAVAGAQGFVCDNLAFSGDGGTVVLRKRHTSRLDLSKVVPPAIDAYLEKAGLFKLDIERMKNADLSEGRAKEVIFDAARNAPERVKMKGRSKPSSERLNTSQDTTEPTSGCSSPGRVFAWVRSSN
jgi:hypothetical protein